MTFQERIHLLAPVVAQFPEMGDFGNADALLELVRVELEADPTFRAIPPRQILHIISANTPMAGMQSLVRGLILGSQNRCKIPGGGLPRFEEFVERLPGELRKLVEISANLANEWRAESDAVVVFGNDKTVEHFHRQSRSGQIFVGYGSRWSGVVIFSDENFSSIPDLCRDVCLYEQMGCLSAQIVWLHESIDAAEYGSRLAAALAQYVVENESQKLTLENAAAISRWRATAEWKAVSDPENRIWLSQNEPVWGVALVGKNAAPSLSCLHRHVTLQSFSDVPALSELASSVSSLGVWPYLPENIELLTALEVSRICPVGRLQFPRPDWRQDGFPALARLVRWQGHE